MPSRYFSSTELCEIAKRIHDRVDAGKVTSLKPETAELCAIALWAYASRPARPHLIAVICGKDRCAIRRDCIACISKANIIEAMYRGDRKED